MYLVSNIKYSYSSAYRLAEYRMSLRKFRYFQALIFLNISLPSTNLVKQNDWELLVFVLDSAATSDAFSKQS